MILDLHNFSSTDPVIGYFWRAVRSFTSEERAKVSVFLKVSRDLVLNLTFKLLQFVSGSSRVPLEGFSSLQGMSGITKFSITSAGATTALPTARESRHLIDTYFNADLMFTFLRYLLQSVRFSFSQKLNAM